jgi:hypothetical protein
VLRRRGGRGGLRDGVRDADSHIGFVDLVQIALKREGFRHDETGSGIPEVRSRVVRVEMINPSYSVIWLRWGGVGFLHRAIYICREVRLGIGDCEDGIGQYWVVGDDVLH